MKVAINGERGKGKRGESNGGKRRGEQCWKGEGLACLTTVAVIYATDELKHPLSIEQRCKANMNYHTDKIDACV